MGIKDGLIRILGGVPASRILNTPSMANLVKNNIVNNSIALYPDWSISGNSERYCTSDDVYSVIKLLSTTAALIPLFVYEQIDDTSAKKLKALPYTASAFTRKCYQVKSMEELPEGDPVEFLLDNPNDYQGKFEFQEALYSSLNMDGEAFIFKQRSEYGVNQGKPIALHVLFAQNVVLRVTNTFPQIVIGYDYVIGGRPILDNCPVTDIIHIKYYNPSFSANGSELRGLSPLKALVQRIERLDAGMDAAVAQLQNGGVKGILVDEQMDDQAVEIIGQRKIQLSQFLRNPDNTGGIYNASGKLQYIPLGLSLADMDLASLEKIDFKKLCNAYNVSDRLFNNDATGSEVSDNNARRGLYTTGCLPNVFRYRDALIRSLLPDFSDDKTFTDSEGEQYTTKGDGKKRFIDADLSEITELQSDTVKTAQALSASWWLTPNQKLAVQNYEESSDPMMDKVYIPSGFTILDDLLPVEPLNTSLNV